MNDLASLIAALVTLAVAASGYARFVLRRSIFPCIEFDVDLAILGRTVPEDHPVGELVLSMRNVGPGTGFVANVRARVRCRRSGDSGTGPDGAEPAFEHALTGGYVLLHGSARNFIQPGVTHWYRKPLLFPADTQHLHVWAAFEYHIEVGRITWALARILTPRPDERLVRYTVRRTFQVTGQEPAGGGRPVHGGPTTGRGT